MFKTYKIFIIWLIVIFIGLCEGSKTGYSQHTIKDTTIADHLVIVTYAAAEYKSKGINLTIIDNILEDQKGIFWLVGSFGLYSYDPMQNKWSIFSDALGTGRSNWIKGIAEDGRGRIWVQEALHGFAYFDGA